MTLKIKAFVALLFVLVLAACGPQATEIPPTPSAEPTQSPTDTPSPTETPLPTRTATALDSTAQAGLASTPGAGADPAQPGAGAGPSGSGTLPAAAAQPGSQPAAGSAPEQYTYLGQNIPDRSQFLPGRAVTITWTVKNTGTVGWTKDYTLRHFAGPKPDEDVYFFTKDVPVNDTINFTVTFTTPAEPGDYDIWFKLTNSAMQNFGDLDLLFTVTNNPTSATSTPSQ